MCVAAEVVEMVLVAFEPPVLVSAGSMSTVVERRRLCWVSSIVLICTNGDSSNSINNESII